jgi:hypothetical protein
MSCTSRNHHTFMDEKMGVPQVRKSYLGFR